MQYTQPHMNNNKLYGYHKAHGLMHKSELMKLMYILRFGRYSYPEQLTDVICSLHQKHIIMVLQYVMV